MRPAFLHTPPSDLVQAVLDAKVVQPDQDWILLMGGRTNHVWRVGSAVVKLYVGERTSPLFPNESLSEIRVLRELSHSSLTAEFLASGRTESGEYCVYGYIPGRGWVKDAGRVGGMMRQLHSVRPVAGIREIEGGAATLVEQTLEMLNQCSETLRTDLETLRPSSRMLPPVGAAELRMTHGDIVPANIIESEGSLRLIDWQCPAVAEPSFDIAIFMSPAMQQLYRGTPLSEKEVKEFWTGYGDGRVQRRYQALAPWFHWRMAAYCAWQVSRGNMDYGAALVAEVNVLRANMS